MLTMRPTRYGGVFKFLLSVVLMAALIAGGWLVYANWGRDADGKMTSDGWRSLDPRDKEFYDTGVDKAKPIVDWTSEKLQVFKQAVWGQEGLLADAERWIARQQGAGSPAEDAATAGVAGSETTATATATREAEPTVADAAPAAPSPEPAMSPGTQRLDDKLHNAFDLFAEGVEHYRAGMPAEHGWTDEVVAEIKQAKNCFQRVREILQDEGTVESYRAAPDHDAVVLHRAEELMLRNQKLLHTTMKIGSF